MRYSAILAPTLREVPSEAEIPSHRLMLRAALMRKVAGGVYTFLPLGHRVLQKIMEIIRQELNQVGCQELLLPIIQPADLWYKSGRWADYGDEMFRLKDRHGRDFCLGPTHEEIVTDLVQKEVRSYKQLPLILYQMQNKYRDEIRPRFGVMRAREFIMKDAYSFDVDQEGLQRSYDKMYNAYSRIFRRCGLETRAALAFAGAIGGDYNHEFIVPSENGEAEVASCSACDYAANIENAVAVVREDDGNAPPAEETIQEVHTPDIKTIEELERFFERPAQQMIKTLLYFVDDKPVAVLIRGDRELSEAKLAKVFGTTHVRPAEPEEIVAITGVPVGFLGPVGLHNIPLIADHEVVSISDGITGANKSDFHLIHVVYGRDYEARQVEDLRVVTSGDPCPECGASLSIGRGIELGHVFQLGTKYSKALGAMFLDEDGKEKPMIMGCYGIGVGRTMAAIIEQHHDEDGIIWPMTVAPYHVHLVVINPKDESQMNMANRLYESLWSSGVETILDDRDERPGVKFKDSDLIGFPLRVVIGPRSVQNDTVEIRERHSRDQADVAVDEATTYLRSRVDQLIAEVSCK